MKWGPTSSEKLSDGEWFRKLAEQGKSVPVEAIEQPTLTRDELPYWEAFNLLHLSRANSGFGAGAIPLSELMAYLDLMQIPIGEEREHYVRVIRAMDHAYLVQIKEKHV